MTNKNKRFICIRCPIGCVIDTTYDDSSKKLLTIKGNNCHRGKEYVISELNDPRRLLTTTVKISNGVCQVLPVATSIEVPKAMLFNIMKELAKIEVESPVKRGNVIVKNILNTKADIIAQCDM